MKILMSSLLVAFVSISFSWAQIMKSSLNDDLSFRQALNAVQYPLLAEPPAKDAKVYVDFIVNKEGKISEVKLLKMGSFSNAFMGEVTRLFADLPIQKPTHASAYVLPVVFESKPKPGVYQPTASDRVAYDRKFVQFLHVKTLLNELYVASK
jgi:hypothetical protein